MKKVLVAGASGHLGREVVRGLLARDISVRALTRLPKWGKAFPDVEIWRGDLLDTQSLDGVCKDVNAVISCAGASMNLRSNQRESFSKVDFQGNVNLLEQAAAEGVKKFVYVSLHSADALADTEYAQGHEQFVEALQASNISGTVVRPTGFFYFMGEILAMAQRGRGIIVGPGTGQTNPVHEADVAACCIYALGRDTPEIEIGGPEIFTRRQVVELAFDVLGKRPRILSVPPGVMRGVARVLRPFNPRLAALVRFGVEVGLIDVVAPARGKQRLRDYFEALCEHEEA